MEFDVSRRMPGPTEVYGKDFDELYEKYEADGSSDVRSPPANSSARSSMHRSKPERCIAF
jgi:hypothetical protein